MDTKIKEFKTSNEMLEWQYFQLLGELQELQRHNSDEKCPCRLSTDLGENCLSKHSLGLSILAAETAAMDETNQELLSTLAGEAKEKHEQIKAAVCGKGEAPEIGKWSRQWRKVFEKIYYTCKVPQKAKVKDVIVEDTQKEKINISCGTEICRIKIVGKAEKPPVLIDETVNIENLKPAVKRALLIVNKKVEKAPAEPSKSQIPDVPVVEKLPPSPVKPEPLPAIVPIIDKAENSFREYIKMLRYDIHTSNYKIENDAILEVPIFNSHSRAKNWLSIISLDPQSPGGLKREFLERGRGDYYYIISKLKPGDAVEFGADYYTGGGSKQASRWYGIVAAITKDGLYLTKTEDARSAIKLSTEVKPLIDFAEMRDYTEIDNIFSLLNDNQTVSNLQKSVQDEQKAIKDYTQRVKQVPKGDRLTLAVYGEIINDEIDHKNRFEGRILELTRGDVSDPELSELDHALRHTQLVELHDVKECGCSVCMNKKGHISKGPEVCGGESSVEIPLDGCHKDERLLAILHNHPSGVQLPSVQDMETAEKHNVAVCIKVAGSKKIKCFAPG